MKKRIFATLLSLLMLVSAFPFGAMPAAAASAQALPDVMENTNQADGVVLRKAVVPHLVGGVPDGTLDVMIEAYTTGVVHHTTTNVPTDIVLVLDVSGSMDDEVVSTTTTTTYNEAYASYVERGFFIWTDDYYGFSSTWTTYYINLGTAAEPHYVAVQHAGVDDNNCDYYWYSGAGDQTVYVYPAMANGAAAPRAFSYPVVQFYSRTVTTDQDYAIDMLKTAVNGFIETTHQKNEEIMANGGTNLHRIALVKFGSASYYGGSASLTEGNERQNNGYNYTQVVKNLTVVDDANHNILENLVNGLQPGGATAVDYGLNLAKMVLAQPLPAGSPQRNKVVIVFSDGQPTHSSNFSTTVANDAIGIANDIKFSGATVYSISVAAGADVSDVTSNNNKFFHYVSSNYPAAESLTNAGAGGDPSRGFYMTPTDTESLAMLFESIAESIESPTIELGSSAQIVDTVSPYFTIPGGASSITLQTADRTAAGGWYAPQPATGVTKNVSGKTLQVQGFDYDENYVSDTPRTKNGQPYYGTKLIITINVQPDYAAIDTHAASVQDGNLPSNDGTANLLNSDGEPIAAVDTPYFAANTVTYQYTAPGAAAPTVFRTYYRLPGAAETVISAAPAVPGYTFAGWSTTDAAVTAGAYTMPQSDVTFVGTFTVNTHDVTYKITGYNPDPANITAPAGATDVPYDTEVTVAPDLTAVGYTFSGWEIEVPDGLTATGGKFLMPDSDVHLIGYFTPADGTPYKTIHYLENLNGQYELEEEISGAGVTGTLVHAVKRSYEGYTLTDVSGVTVVGEANPLSTVNEGNIAADGSLILRQFHKRNTYTVTYHYDGAIPADAPALPTDPVYVGEYKHGAPVPIAPHAEQDAMPYHDFAGWHSIDKTTVTDTDTSLVMPIGGIHLYGDFSHVTNASYTVEHYFADTNDQYQIDPLRTQTVDNVLAGETVTASPLKVAGYVYNDTASAATKTGTVTKDGNLVLKLYYDRAAYTVTYKYTGTLPANRSPLPPQATVKYGTSVNVAPDATAVGYDFSGWSVETPAGLTLVPGTPASFVMPAENVVLVGEFTGSTGTGYKTIHYLENLDGTYTKADEILGTGTTDEPVTAAVREYPGYTLTDVTGVTVVYADSSTAVLSTVPSGTIAADGSFTMHQFHNRNTYTVTYHYDGAVPAGAPALPTDPVYVGEYKHGAPVPIAPHAEQEAMPYHNFAGWHSIDKTTVTDTDTSLVMPIGGIHLYGTFSIITGVEYNVEHYFENESGDYVKNAAYDEHYNDGIAGETVTAAPVKVAGYKENTVHADRVSSAVLPGTGSVTLKLFYERLTYTVTYEYTGTVPAGHSTLPAAATVKYGTTVNVAADATAPDHTFSGWSVKTPAGLTLVDGTPKTFTMPHENVVLVGSFSAHPEYDVEYWLQNPNNLSEYVKNAASHTHVAPEGAAVTAHAREFPGYELSTTQTQIASGTVPALPARLVLKLYYDLLPYTVTFEVDGQIPAGVPAIETIPNKYYGDAVPAPDYTNISGYRFDGWTSQEVGSVVPGASFTMPAKNVTLKGTFTALNADYVIEHYLMNDEGNYNGVVPHTVTLSGVVGDSVRATSYRPYLDMGAKIDTSAALVWEGTVIADDPATTGTEQLVLKLYYSREPAVRVEYHYAGDLTQSEWQALGWPDLPTDATLYYVGAQVNAKGFATSPAEMTFDGWYASNPTIQVSPNGSFTVPRLPGTNPVIKLYGRWVSSVFTVKYFVDGVEQSQNTRNYPFGTPVTVMDKIPDTAARTYTPWQTPVSVTDGVAVVTNPDGTITMNAAGEIHIKCTSSANDYTVSYYLNNMPYRSMTVKAGDEHTILDAPTTGFGQIFTGWSTPATESGDSVTTANGKFTMPAANVVIHGAIMTTQVPAAELQIHKEVKAPDGFTGGKTYTFNIYTVNGTQSVLAKTVTVTVGADGKGVSDEIALSSGVDYRIEEVNAGVAGYTLATAVKNEAGADITGQTFRIPLSFSPAKITVVNTYEEIALVTDDHFGYIIGYPDGTVRPEASITRAEVATIFFRLLTDAKRAEYWAQSNPFTDVSDDEWYNNAISTLYKAGVLTGYEDNSFRPDNAITRAELVKISMSFYGSPAAGGAAAFADTQSHWAQAFIDAAAAMGFVDGYGNGTFLPDQPVTRAEAMKIINRTLNRVPHKDYLMPGMITWSDNADLTAWYYAEVQEATNSHAYAWSGQHEIWNAILPVRDWAALEKKWSDAND